MLLLAILLQVGPPLADCADSEPITQGTPAPCSGILSAEETGRALLKRVAESEAALKMHKATAAGYQAAAVDMQKICHESISKRAREADRLGLELALLKAQPTKVIEPPWYHSAWLWAPVAAIVSGSTVWGLTR